MVSIDIWGDSVFKGVTFDEESGRYSLLKNNGVARLSQRFNLDFHNHSKFGLTAPKALKLIEANLEKGPAPEYAVIELGGNDCDFNWKAVSENPDGDFQPNTPLDQYMVCLRNIIAKLRAASIKPILVNLPPIDASRYFSWISKGLDAANILRFLGTKEQIYRHHEGYSIAMMDVAKEQDVEMIDIRRPLIFSSRTLDFLCIDGIHLNEAGHALMAKFFGEFISSKMNLSPALA